MKIEHIEKICPNISQKRTYRRKMVQNPFSPDP
jgi:hypothetical protein